MDYSSDNNLFSKKHIIYALILLILILAIPLVVRLTQQQQQLKSRASASEVINFVEGDKVKCNGSGCTTTDPNVQVDIKAPDF